MRLNPNNIVPTAPAGTSTNQAASTAFVTGGIAAAIPIADSSAKAWVEFDNSGAILVSYNVTSVTKNGTGDFTVNFTTNFASANYVCVATGRGSSTSNGWGQVSHGTAPTASAVRVLFITPALTLYDPDSGHVACFGRQ